MTETISGSDHWLALYHRFRGTMRKAAFLIAALCVVAWVDGFRNLRHLGRRYQVAHEFLLSVEERQPYRARLAVFYRDHFNPEQRVVGSRLRIDALELPELSWDLWRHLEERGERRTYVVLGQEVGAAPYVLAFQYGAFVALLVVVAVMFPIRRLHALLWRAGVRDTRIQQELNSLFFDRVTASYPERWRTHVWVGATALLVLALMIPFVFEATHTIIRADTQVEIDSLGAVFNPLHKPMTTQLVVDGNLAAGRMLGIWLATLVVWVVMLRVALGMPRGASPGPSPATRPNEEG